MSPLRFGLTQNEQDGNAPGQIIQISKDSKNYFGLHPHESERHLWCTFVTQNERNSRSPINFNSLTIVFRFFSRMDGVFDHPMNSFPVSQAKTRSFGTRESIEKSAEI